MKLDLQESAKGATNHMKSILTEFKSFAFKGNVVDMAVGVIIGAAFGKIVDSLVKNILMPMIGLLTPGDLGYLGWKVVVGAKEVPYGLFIGEIVNFVIVAFALYLFMVKFMGFLTAKKSSPEATLPAPPETTDQTLLREIRDLLASQKH